jgi:hypothetical protein
MPSLYSPNLKIELMATGEKSGQWGTVTNDNLQNALEAAIVGESTVTFAGADETLALGDSTAPQAARSLKLTLTGLFAGTRTLNLPAIKKSYLIKNNSSGGDANNVIIKVTSSAGTTVTIPTGRTVFVYVDSVNVVEAFNHFDSLSIGQLATALAVGSGGTGRTTLASGGLVLGAGTSAVNTLVGTSVGQIPQWDGSTWATGSLPAGGVTSVTASSPLASSGGGTPNLSLTGTVAVANGGTGQTGTPTNGQLLIGNGSGFTRSTISAGTGISITNGSGSISIAATGTAGVTTFSAGTTGLTPSTGTSGAVTLAGTLALANGGTGATTAANARTNLGVTATGSDTTYAFRANNLSDLASASTARNNLGLGSVATLSSVSLTSNVTGVLPVANGGTGGTLPVANGGTGSTTLAGAGIATLSGTQTFTGDKTFNSIIAASYNFTANSSVYFDAGTTIKMDISGTNRFNMTASVAQFNMSDVQKVGGGTFNTISDRRHKQDITVYEKGLTELKQLSLVNYRYTSEFMKAAAPSKQFVGLIAQDVQNTGFSDSVVTDDKGYLALDTSQLTYALINAVKELSSKVEVLEAEIAALKGV